MSLIGSRLYKGASGGAVWPWYAAPNSEDVPGGGLDILAGGFGAANVVNAAVAANSQRLHPFMIGRSVTVSRLLARVVTGVAATACRLAIYRQASETDWTPTSLVYQTAELATTASATTIGETGLSLALQADTPYYLGWWGNGAPTIVQKNGWGGHTDTFITVVGLIRSDTYTVGVSEWPDPWVTTSMAAQPSPSPLILLDVA